jgi:hypothetical protein
MYVFEVTGNNVKRGSFLALIVLCVSVSACKKEPEYQLKEPFGLDTMSAADDSELGIDIVKIPKKNFDRGKWEEKQRHNLAIKKILKQARDYDPKIHK